MRFSTRLNISVLPFIILPPLIVVSLFRFYTLEGMEGLKNELLSTHLSTFSSQIEAEYSILKRLSLERVDFYVRNTQRKVLEAAAEVAFPGSGTVFILDAAGSLLYPDEGVLDLSRELRGEILASPEAVKGFMAGSGRAGQSYLAHCRVFDPWGWVVGVAALERDVFQPVANATGGAVAVFIVVTLLSIGVLLFLSRSMAGPVNSLLEATQRMGAGDLKARAEVVSGDEFGALARSYNAMADRLQMLNTGLEQRVEERTRELERSLDRLRETQNQLVEKEKMAALGALVAGIAHEINTPLGVGVTASSFLKQRTEEVRGVREADGLSKPELDEFMKTAIDSCDIISRNLERAHRLIRSFKQLAMDQSSDETRRFGIAGYLRDIVISLDPELKGRAAEISLDCDEKIEMEGVPGLLAQVFTNLIMNSLIHGFAHGSGGRISISVSRQEGMIHIIYSDNGRGMEPETLKHLYEPFYTTRRGQGGSGLGMNIVYTIVTRKFGGTIHAESAAAGGVRYEIRLPEGG
jgi:signal transduction histidine kinase